MDITPEQAANARSVVGELCAPWLRSDLSTVDAVAVHNNNVAQIVHATLAGTPEQAVAIMSALLHEFTSTTASLAKNAASRSTPPTPPVAYLAAFMHIRNEVGGLTQLQAAQLDERLSDHERVNREDA